MTTGTQDFLLSNNTIKFTAVSKEAIYQNTHFLVVKLNSHPSLAQHSNKLRPVCFPFIENKKDRSKTQHTRQPLILYTAYI